MFIKDAFLVFRALSKLTMKPLNTERYVPYLHRQDDGTYTQHSERDLKSHAMRSKLLSLHLVLTILNSHMALFVDPNVIIYSASTREATTFIQAVNQFLCLSLSRNAVSPVPQVFEASVEIFWRVLSGMRTKLKVP
jgi:brefeldin A-inhibited guanine nucleotide-exchange protein